MPLSRILSAALIFLPLFIAGQDIDEAIKLFNMYKFDQSRVIFEDIVQKADHPRIAEAHYYLGRLCINPDSALIHYQRVIKDYPQSRFVGEAYLEIAKMKFAREDYQNAIVVINELLRNYPDIPFKDQAQFWLGVSYIGAGQKEIGYATLRTMIAANPKSDWAVRAANIIPGNQPSDVPKDFYTIQVGSYRNQSNAQKMAADLKAKGFEVSIVEAQVLGNTYYRVWVGQFPTPDAAKAQAVKLEALGIKGNVVKGY